MGLLLKKIGFDRTVEIQWLQKTAEMSCQNISATEINQRLDDLLLDQIKGKDARRKTRTVLMAVWAKTKKELHPLRADAFELLRSLKPQERLAIHWGMCMAVHPFFGDVATVTGRLIRLQGNASGSEIQRRIQELYGERGTIPRVVQRLICTLQKWGVLTPAKAGIYEPANSIHICEKRTIVWLIEAFLCTYDNAPKTIQGILKHPVFFPFEFQTVTPLDLRLNSRLDVIQQALDEELVMLRRNELSPVSYYHNLE